MAKVYGRLIKGRIDPLEFIQNGIVRTKKRILRRKIKKIIKKGDDPK